MTMINDTISAAHCTTLMSSTAPTIAPFTTKLAKLSQTVNTTVGGWSVTDARLGNAALTLTPGTASAATTTLPAPDPSPSPAHILSPIAATIENAPTGTGHGDWDFPGDTGSANSLAILLPGNAEAGSYSSTLTFTTAPPAS